MVPTSAAEGIAFFVVGCPRSGTTLLRAMLDSHPDVCVPPENYFTTQLLWYRADLERRDGVAVDHVLEVLRATPSFGQFGISVDDLDARWREHRPSTIADATRDIYRIYAQRAGKAFVGDKTPHHVDHVEMLADTFGEARFVHLIRDGRDVAASLAAAHFGPDSLAGASFVWRRHVLSGIVAGRRLGAARYAELRYEDLVDDPTGCVDVLCDFLGLRRDAAMLSYHERADELLAPVAIDDHIQGIRRPVTKTRDWRVDLSRNQVEVFEVLHRDMLAVLSYETLTARDRRSVRLEARAVRLAHTVRQSLMWHRKLFAQPFARRPVQAAARRAAAT